MKQYGLIGKKLGHSFSQAYFQDKFEKLGLTDCSYSLFEIESIQEFPRLVSSLSNLKGLNVTIPYKVEVIPFLSELDPIAQKIGAVNTIKIHSNGKSVGYNTDYYGFRDSLLPLLKSHHTKALVLGDGGASKAVQAVLTNLSIPFLVVSRYGNFQYQSLTEDLIREHSLLIQTTPVGMYPHVNDFLSIPYQAITSQHLLYDLIYNPLKTVFIQRGNEARATTKNGLEMLNLQAEYAWKCWNLEV